MHDKYRKFDKIDRSTEYDRKPNSSNNLWQVIGIVVLLDSCGGISGGGGNGNGGGGGGGGGGNGGSDACSGVHRGVRLGRGSSRFSERQTVRADAVKGYVDDDDRSTEVAVVVVAALLVEESNRKVIRRFRGESKYEEKGIRWKWLLSLPFRRPISSSDGFLRTGDKRAW